MLFAEINRKFTEAVADLMARGYVINTATMGGSQGEVGKVDLTDGKEIIRVVLDNFGTPVVRIEGRFYRMEGLKLIVGRVTDQVTPNSQNAWQTVWNGNLEVISEDVFYEIGREHRDGSKWYGTREEAITQQDKEAERYRTRYIEKQQEFPDAAREIVLPFIRRQPRCKSVRLSEIEKITKHHSRSRTGRMSVQYVVNARGNSYTLG